MKKDNTLGRFSTIFHLSISEFNLASLNTINNLLKQKIKTFIFSLFLFYLLEKYSVFSLINGIEHSRVKLNIKSLCVIFIFSLCPSDKIKISIKTIF